MEASVKEICEWFDVPVEMVGEPHPVREAVKLAEEEREAFLEFSIKPWLEAHGEKGGV